MNKPNADKENSLLEVRGLKTQFRLQGGRILRAVDGIDLNVRQGEIHGLVGESGCGKTVASLSILRLIGNPGSISQGKILWKGNDLLELKKGGMRKVRGKEIAMIFQNPQASLNPLYTIGSQIRSIIRLHRSMSKNQATEEAIKLLNTVNIPDPKSRMDDYPNQLSGGMCQRALIAIALSCRPKLLIADEPTASLDGTIQAQILDLLLELRKTFAMAILLISHDMGVVARMCDRISVMYLGKIVEEADTDALYAFPKHPYTEALLKAVPVPDPKKKAAFALLRGDVPSSIDMPQGCRFRPRCPKAFEKCIQEPSLEPVAGNGNKVACWLYEQDKNI